MPYLVRALGYEFTGRAFESDRAWQMRHVEEYKFSPALRGRNLAM